MTSSRRQRPNSQPITLLSTGGRTPTTPPAKARFDKSEQLNSDFLASLPEGLIKNFLVYRIIAGRISGKLGSVKTVGPHGEFVPALCESITECPMGGSGGPYVGCITITIEARRNFGSGHIFIENENDLGKSTTDSFHCIRSAGVLV